ncbi:MAG: hypothetical protein BRC29_05205 [Nanohaloarchaea archaeon SW_7_43_1]|nr:MAG: hypothetical protein BRC29_05205 [Nanohaloarchaea archaeon SW_7_43_1]
MDDQKLIQEARESGEEVKEGLMWHTYTLDDVVVQIPREGDEWRLDRIRDIYDQLDSEVPKPNIRYIENEEDEGGVVFERVNGEMFRNFKQRLEDQEDNSSSCRDLRENYLDAVENAGEALALIHSSEVIGEGFGYFNREEDGIKAPYDTWRGYVEEKVDELQDVPEIFERAAQIGLENFDLEKVPEKPDRRILHEDFNSSNLMIEDDASIKVFDYDNAIYGDPNFGFINSMYKLCDFDDKDALERFREGYISVRELDMSEGVEENYVALAVLKSVGAGKWVHENRDVEFLDSLADDVNSWAEEHFG